MAEVIRMPRLSDTMTEGVIAAWHKKVGDKVKPGDVLAEVETDKATMDLESYQSGTLLYIGVEKGKAVKVEGIIAVIGKEGEDFRALLNETTPSAAPSTPTEQPQEKTSTANTQAPVALPKGAKEIRMPLLSDTMTEGKIVSWNKKVGDFVKSDDVLAEVETDKATMEVVGYEEGTLLYIGVEAGKAAKVNDLIAIIGKKGTDVSAYVAADKQKTPVTTVAPTTTENEGKPEPVAENETVVIAASENNERIKASPLARKMAADKGIDLNNVSGSGDGGRITRRDIESYKPAEKTATTATKPAVVNGQESYTDVPVSQMRKVIARRLSESKYTAPHFYLNMEIVMDNCMLAREAMNAVSPVKISFNDIVIKACATALKSHPAVNSSWMDDFIRENHHIHIGTAVALPEGLIVPVVKFADQKTLAQIAAETKELYGKARDKKLQPQEFSGNTFTISNLGMMDIDSFTAIINPPDSCILAVGKIKEVVVRKGDGFGVNNVMTVTLSCDHRSVDGAVGSAFLQTLKKLLENPVTMLV